MLRVDERSQIQALDRMQPVLPMRPGLPERRTHDYRRHGTTSLFAALIVAGQARMIGELYPDEGFARVAMHGLATQPEEYRKLFSEALQRNVPGRGRRGDELRGGIDRVRSPGR